MEEPIYKVIIRTGTYEQVPGFIDFQLKGGMEKVITLKSDTMINDFYVRFKGYLKDSEDNICGIEIYMDTDTEECKTFEIHNGETLKQSVWTTCVDDDGYPEDVCINYEITLCPIKDAPEDSIKSI